MLVEMKAGVLQGTQRVRTQINHKFLDYDVCYRIDEVQQGPLLAQGLHRHDTDQFLIPLRGQFYIELQGGSRITSMALVLGKKYRIRAGLEHRLLTSGGLLESFLPGAGFSETPAYLAEEAWREAGEQQDLLSQMAVTPIIEYTPRPGVSGQDGRVEVDTQVPGTRLGRKVYFAPLDRERKLTSPHRHKTSHVLICMVGRVWLAYRELGAPVQIQEMISGRIYVVPPQLPHQIYMGIGSVMASYFPAATWLSREEELEQLDEDWFL